MTPARGNIGVQLSLRDLDSRPFGQTPETGSLDYMRRLTFLVPRNLRIQMLEDRQRSSPSASLILGRIQKERTDLESRSLCNKHLTRSLLFPAPERFLSVPELGQVTGSEFKWLWAQLHPLSVCCWFCLGGDWWLSAVQRLTPGLSAHYTLRDRDSCQLPTVSRFDWISFSLHCAYRMWLHGWKSFLF